MQAVLSLNGKIELPGSKSIANRALLIASFAKNQTILTQVPNGDDVNYMINSLRLIGVDIKKIDEHSYKFKGIAGAPNLNKERDLFIGNSGTTARFLTAALSFGTGVYRIQGNQRMSERPIAHLVDALRQLGANINYLGNTGYPPLEITGFTNVTAAKQIVLNSTISSQFLSAMLMSAPFYRSSVEIIIDGELVSTPYVDMTISIMEQFGVEVVNNNYRSFYVKSNQYYNAPHHYQIEPDASSASYFAGAAAVSKGNVTICGLNKNCIQGDIQFFEILEAMGANVHYLDDAICVEGTGLLKGLTIDATNFPDAAMTLATIALFSSGTTVINGIGTWRVKECDRLNAISCELIKLGASVIHEDDFIAITPPASLLNTSIETYDDHRMAMSFSLVKLYNKDINILNKSCVSKTFPDFFEKFNSRLSVNKDSIANDALDVVATA